MSTSLLRSSKGQSIALALAVLWFAPSLHAELSATADGTGALSRQGQQAATINRAEISLKVDGSFIISLFSPDREVFKGAWEQGRGNVIELSITEALGKSAASSGQIITSNDRVQRIDLGSPRRDPYNAVFVARGRYTDFLRPEQSVESIDKEWISAPQPRKGRGRVTDGRRPSAPIVAAPRPRPTAPQPPQPPQAAQPPASESNEMEVVRTTVKGTGKYSRSSGESRPFTAMEIFLRARGVLHLKMFGPGVEEVLAGSWRPSGSGPRSTRRYELRITSGFGRGPTSGAGYILLGRDNYIEQLHVEGSSQALRSGYTLSFWQD